MQSTMRRRSESGVAMVLTLLVLALASALAIGFFASVTADQRASGIDRDQTQAYAAAHAGLEKLTTDLAKLWRDTGADGDPRALLEPILVVIEGGETSRDVQNARALLAELV